MKFYPGPSEMSESELVGVAMMVWDLIARELLFGVLEIIELLKHKIYKGEG